MHIRNCSHWKSQFPKPDQKEIRWDVSHKTQETSIYTSKTRCGVDFKSKKISSRYKACWTFIHGLTSNLDEILAQNHGRCDINDPRLTEEGPGVALCSGGCTRAHGWPSLRSHIEVLANTKVRKGLLGKWESAKNIYIFFSSRHEIAFCCGR